MFYLYNPWCMLVRVIIVSLNTTPSHSITDPVTFGLRIKNSPSSDGTTANVETVNICPRPRPSPKTLHRGKDTRSGDRTPND